jgi:ATP-dependent HslUV protease ATP-binding subunit HslU
MEKVLEEISFKAPNIKPKTITVDRAYVRGSLKDIVKNADLKRFIL